MHLEPASFVRTIRILIFTIAASVAGATSHASADSPELVAHAPHASLLAALNSAFRALSHKVGPTVVEVRASGYAESIGPEADGQGVVLQRRENVGSGVVVDPKGFILTNAHVIEGADRVDVELAAPPGNHELPGERARHSARVVGIAKDIDVALLKFEPEHDLQALKIGDSTILSQGDVVFAFGSPAGLANSMTMGIVSAVARQLDQDSPSSYIQTDAPINPGDSGGPLVNADGELIGLNTLVLSASGGSQGLGFAIPARVLQAVYPQLRDYGSLPRTTIGVQVQAISPPLARHLGLVRSSGVIVSDVAPTGPGRDAGVQVQDIIVAVDGSPVPDVPSLALTILPKGPGSSVTLALLRGRSELSVRVVAADRKPGDDVPDTLTLRDRQPIPRLGILAGSIEAATAMLLSGQRVDSGVLVVGLDGHSRVSDEALVAGDIIHAVNGIVISSIDALSVLVEAAMRNSHIVLQIERRGKLQYVVQTIY
jgi:serine protease Do